MYAKKITVDGRTYVHVYVNETEKVDIPSIKKEIGEGVPFFLVRNGRAPFEKVIIDVLQYISDCS